MKDRIKKYMEYKDISAGELASLLEVQRSNISHILNGRNKPGAAFIEKLLVSFPDLDARWLITGVGEMVSGGNVSVTKETLQKNETFVSPQKVQPDSTVRTEKIGKAIARVVLLYTDGTFIDYDKN